MTGKRTKRLLSLLLSVLLVAGMLPMGALAAPYGPNGDDYVEVKLMAGDMPGYETNTQSANNLATWFTKQAGYVTNTTDKTAALAAATAMNNTFQQANAVMEGSTKVADIEVGQDGNFYLAVGFDSSNLKDGKGVGTVDGAPFAFNLAYNIDAFEFVKTNLKGRDDVMAEANPVIGGTLINGTDESWGDYDWETYVSQDFVDVDMGNNYKVTFTDKHAQSYDGYNATSTPKYGGGVNIQFANQNAKAYRLSSQATWTVVMKVHVKADAAPGLYYFSYPETDTESSIYLLEKNDGTATDFIGINPAEKYRENMKYLKTTDLVVKVLNTSKDPAGTEDDYNQPESAIKNVKNLPYVSTKADYTEDTDTITFPAVEDTGDGFRLGDTVVVYGDEACTKELGRTVLSEGPAGNFVDRQTTKKTDASDTGTYTLDEGATTLPRTDNGVVGGRKLKLIDVDETRGNGWSYIKGEPEVWIKRLQPTTGDTPKDPSAKAIKITVEPEVLNYTGDITYPAPEIADDVKTQLDGYSADNPIELHVGDSIKNVVNKLTAGGVLENEPTLLVAPVETVDPNGATVMTKLQYAWDSASLYNGAADGMTQEGTNAEGVYVRHGHFVIRNPFASAQKGVNGGTAGDTTVVAEQPTDTYDAEHYPIPLGQVIYVNVVPNPSDYYLTNLGEATKTQSLVVKGETNSKAKNNDLIYLYKGEKPDNTVMGQAWPAAPGSNTQQIPRLDNLSADWSADPVPAEVWLSYQNSVNGTTDRYDESDRAKITVVTDATNPVVSGDVDVNSDAKYLGAEIEIDKDDTLNDILEQIGDVEYEIIGPMDPAPVPTKKLKLTYSQAQTLAAESCDVAMTTPANPVPVIGAEAKTALNATGKAVGTAFTISYTIPDSAKLTTMGAGGEDTYTNPSGYKVYIDARVSDAISLSDNAKIEVTENKPLVPTDVTMFDTIRITDDTRGKLYSALQANANIEIRTYNAAGTPVGTTKLAGHDVSEMIQADAPVTVGTSVRYSYTVKVSQTARNLGDEIYLKILKDGATLEEGGSISGGRKFTVGVQEEYAAFAPVAPAPDKVQIKKEDLPDPYTAENVLARMDAMGTVSGPMVKYGYYGESMAQDTVGSGTVAVFSANPFSGETGRWTTTATDFVTDYATFDMDMTKWVNPTTAPDGLKINYVTGQWTDPASMQIQAKVVDDKYDDDKNPKASEVLKLDNLKVVNNAYPADDVITVQDKADYKTGLDAVAPGTTLTVDIYNKIGGVSTHIGKVTLTGEDAERPIVLDDGLDIKTVLDAMGGNVLFTVRTTDKEEEEAASNPVSVSYDVEPYTLWETSSILPDTIAMRRTDVTTGGNVDQALLTNRLAKTMTATAVHFRPTGVVDAEPLTVSVEKWLKVDGTEFADADDFAAYFAGTSPSSYQIKAQYAPAQAGSNKDGETGKFIRVTGNNGVVDAPLVVPTGTDTPDGYNVSNAVTVKLDADINAPDPNANPKTPTPDKASFVANGGNENDDNPSNDEIVISIAEATNKDALVGAHVVISYIDSEGVSHYETTTGTISGDINNDGTIDDNDYAITINKTTESWFEKGLALSGGTATYWFKLDDHEKSDSFTGTFAGQMAALKIIDDTTISTLTMSIGTVTTNDELLEYVLGRKADKSDAITTAKALITGNIVVGLDSNFPDEVPLVKDGETVTWKLEKNTGSGWVEVLETSSTTVPPAEEGGESTTVTDNNNWATELAKDEAATIEYRLRADFDIDAYNTAHPGKTIQNGEDAELKVAFVKLSLYNNLDPDETKHNPLQLKEGNSDLYLHSEDAKMPDGKTANPAYTELEARKAAAAEKGQTVTKDSYKYDVILYYGSEKFEEQNEIYEGGVKIKPWDLSRYVLKGDSYAGLFSVGVGENKKDAKDWIAEQLADGTKEVTVQIDEIPLNNDGIGETAPQLYDVNVNYGTAEAPDMKTEKHIQPYLTSEGRFDITKCFLLGELGGTQRSTEYYKIVYTVTVKNKDGSGEPVVYTETRKVKLRYRPGDVDMSGGISSLDASKIMDRLADKYLPFLEKELDGAVKVKVAEMERQMMDVDGSGGPSSLDAAKIMDYLAGKFTFLYQRF